MSAARRARTCEVNLLDFRAASTVMQYQIITTGERWWARDMQADLYETVVLSEKTELDDLLNYSQTVLLRDAEAG